MQGAMIVGALFLVMGAWIIGNAYLDGYESAENKHVRAAAENLRKSNEEVEELRTLEQAARQTAEARAREIEASGAQEIDEINRRANIAIEDAQTKAEQAMAIARQAGETEDQQCPALCLLPSSD